MDVSATGSTAFRVQGPLAQNAGGSGVDKNEFLRLFTMQLRYQNPLNPMNSTDFTSQLAQFSSLEQLQGINGQLQQLLSLQRITQAAFSTGLIGKEVKFAEDRVYLNGSADISYTLPSDAARVKITFLDSTGRTVREVERGQQNAGECDFTWDGKDGAGVPLPEGIYTFKVEATNAAGAPLQVDAMSVGTVTGVTFADNDMVLIVDGKMTIHLGDILQILGGGS